MLRFASSVVQSVADTLTPLYRSPVESLTHAWAKAEEALKEVERQQQLSTGEVDQTETAPGKAANRSSASSSSPPPSWCSPALLSALNGMVEAVRRESSDKYQQASHNKTTSISLPSSAPSSTSSSSPSSPLPLSPTLSPSPLPSTAFVGAKSPALSSSPASHTPIPASFAPPRASNCGDFLVQERIVERLCRLAALNRPVGLRVVLIRAIIGLLTASATPVLARGETATAVFELMQRSSDDGELKRKNSGRLPLLHLCRAVAAKIQRSPVTAATWMAPLDRLTNGSSSHTPPHPPTPPPSFSRAFLLTSLLLSMVNFWSTEGRVAVAGMFDLACTPGQPPLKAFLIESSFPAVLVAGVVELVQQLPPVSSCPPFSVLFRTHEAATQLLDRLRFIDGLCQCGPSDLADLICADYSAALLERCIGPMLMDVREDVARWATLFLHHCLKEATSSKLRASIVHFTLGPSPSMFAPSIIGPAASVFSPASSASPVDRALLIRRTLIRRLDSLSEALCQSTLQLLIALLQTRDPLVLECLIPRSISPSTTPSPSDTSSPGGVPSSLEDGLGSPAPSSSSSSFVFSPALFEGLDAPQSHVDYADSLLDAQAEAAQWTAAFSEAPPSLPASPFYPTSDAGMFLTTLTAKLDSLLDHRLSINLRLSQVVTLLFYCPLPRIRRLLTATSHSSPSSPPSVLSTLAAVWKAGRRRQLRLTSFPARLAACKQRTTQATAQPLLTGGAEGGALSATELSGALTGAPAGVGLESLDVETFMQAWLVLEGSILEVAAISETEQRMQRLNAAATTATGTARKEETR